ncbi:ANTAR domain-containing response regulator [Romboutsia sp.]|uniref:ANTAR domain-containing response regulator n=1 Tax=Romboutsia sp. TaxID=1965302 RepID=UPI003F3DCD7A
MVITGNEASIREEIRRTIEGVGYKVVAEAYDGFDAIKVCRQHNPDIVLMEIEMPLLDGISAAQIISKEDIAGAIVFLVQKVNKDIINKIKIVGARGCVFKPIEKEHLISTIEIAIYTGNEFRKIKKEKEAIEQKFEDRKAIDKAKGILMVNENLTEDEAYSKIRKYSMEKRVTMREISEFIIVSYKFKI